MNSNFFFFFSILVLSHLSNSQTCLSEPPELQWTKVTSETHPFLKGIYTGNITLDAHTITIENNNLLWKTRLFDGMLPGPTIRLKRGFEYRLKVINNLGPESSLNPATENVPKDPNTTNLHTHGLHTSGQRPGDNNYMEIGPGETYEYTWILPCDHSGGVHAYHPHHHGSTQSQVSGGAIGALVVEDDAYKESLPFWYSNMTQFLVIIQRFDLPRIESIFNTTIDAVFYVENLITGPTQVYDLDRSFQALNGEYKPTICLNSNEWTKLRIAHVDPFNPGYFIFDEACDILLLARDGIIIHGENDTSIPRQLSNEVWLTHLGRADIAIYCPGSPSGSTTYNITRDGTYDSSDSTSEVIGYLHVSGTDTSPTYPQTILTPFTPSRPSYLKNLLNIPRTELLTQNVSSPGRIPWETIDYFSIKITDNTFNDVSFAGEYNYTYEIPIDSIVEFYIDSGGGEHPLHMHVNHMQIVYRNASIPYGFQERGDFVDLFYMNGAVRWQADTWGGTITLHCHILEHEDQGAMSTLLIQGGCDYDYNTSLDVEYGECKPDYTLCSDTWAPTMHPVTSSPTAGTISPTIGEPTSRNPSRNPTTFPPTGSISHPTPQKPPAVRSGGIMMNCNRILIVFHLIIICCLFCFV